MGCDCYRRLIPPYRHVSIHAPVWGATYGDDDDSSDISFNPRTRVGCDEVDFFIEQSKPVSIHAPVWGATQDQEVDAQTILVSIHAPVWGATVSITAIRPPIRFNPRTRVGCDIGGFLCGRLIGFQSTHPCGVRLKTTN